MLKKNKQTNKQTKMGISSGTSTRWLFVHSIQIELEIEKTKKTNTKNKQTNIQKIGSFYSPCFKLTETNLLFRRFLTSNLLLILFPEWLSSIRSVVPLIFTWNKKNVLENTTVGLTVFCPGAGGGRTLCPR